MISLLHCPNNNDDVFSAFLPTEAETLELGGHLSKILEPGLRIWLNGDLGSGKTTLTRGILRGLDYQGKVKSPTYTLIEPYTISRLDLYHFDFYRFLSPEEFLDAGLDEYFTDTGICLVEWPEKALPYLPEPDLNITLNPEHEGRKILIAKKSNFGQRCIKNLIKFLPL